ncbi:MAG TPA: aspartyl-tRNA amidotransferase [Firmicutes bacterium]|nr:aspartyl-tRNA amidotransferase [Bacillota bacterium]HWR55560.1 GatB/YqeY domain-containing protein [Negativicutes bacterium]
MSLKARLAEDMKLAMKEKEAGKLRLSTIRMVRAAVKNLEIDKKRELTEEEVLEVLAREVKMRRDASEEFQKAGRDDLVQAEQAEIAILSAYLPKQLDETEIRQLVRTVIAEVGASSEKELGKVMSALMPKVKGRSDGKLVNTIVRAELAKQ